MQMGQKIRFLLHIYPSYFAFSYPVLLKSALNTRQLQIRSKFFDFSYEEKSKSWSKKLIDFQRVFSIGFSSDGS